MRSICFRTMVGGDFSFPRIQIKQYFKASLRDVYKIMLAPAAVVWAAALLALIVFRVIL